MDAIEIEKRWTGDLIKVDKSYDQPALSGENGTLKICLTPDEPPFSFVANGRYSGNSVELIYDFAAEYGYSISFDGATVASCMVGMASGKYDLWIGNNDVTEERKLLAEFAELRRDNPQAGIVVGSAGCHPANA